MKLTNEDVEEILRLLDSSGYDEVHLDTGSFKLSLSRTGEGDWVRQHEVTREPVIDRPAPSEGHRAPGAGTGAGLAVDEATDPQTVDTGLADVPAPLPGTFYRAPRPGAAPFVEVGTPVEPATVVGIVETMKLMNSVHAGVAGVVEQIGVANAQPVIQGTVLMRIRPAPP